MKRKYVLCLLMIFVMLVGCTKNNNETSSQDKGDSNVKETTQNNSEDSDEKMQESEYSAEKADAILEGLGIKSHDIWLYLRPETGEETENFLNMEYEKYISDLIEELGDDAKPQKKEEYIKNCRNLIHGKYKIEQQEPLVIKVNCKNDTCTAYLSENQWQEKAYAYISPNGYLFKDNDKWYEIQGYNDYKEVNWFSLWDCRWTYSGNAKNGEMYTLSNNLIGYDKRDENEYNEEKIEKEIKEFIYSKEEAPEGVEYVCRYGECTYNCEEFIINVYYSIDEIDTSSNFVDIMFYTMLDEYKAVKCHFSVFDSNGYFDEITEEKLREIFTIREYK